MLDLSGNRPLDSDVWEEATLTPFGVANSIKSPKAPKNFKGFKDLNHFKDLTILKNFSIFDILRYSRFITALPTYGSQAILTPFGVTKLENPQMRFGIVKF